MASIASFISLVVLTILTFTFNLFFFNATRSGEVTAPGTFEEEPRTIYFDRLVLTVIDAFRYDFLGAQWMPFTYEKVTRKDGAFARLTHLDTPTVTLPRIRALTSGAIATYFDVLSNFDAAQTNDDSFLRRFRERNKRIVFYGDETWLKLFGTELFEKRSEGVSSFFVSDFVEVDVNVTRNVHRELFRSVNESQSDSKAEADFDVLILHLLGLDHLGHVYGPRNARIGPKLAEMDRLIQSVHERLFLSGRDSNTEYARTLLIVCGDHGMADGGGHGGSSHAETHTLTMFMSDRFLPDERQCKQASSGGENMSEDDRAKREDKIESEIQQVDISAYVSILFGLPFPKSSVGIVSEPILRRLLSHTVGCDALDTHVRAGCVANLEHLLRGRPSLAEAISLPLRLSTRECFALLRTAQQRILADASTYCEPCLLATLLGFALLAAFVSLIAYYNALFSAFCESVIHVAVFCALFLSFVALFGSSFVEEEHQIWYFFVTVGSMIFLVKPLLASVLKLTKRNKAGHDGTVQSSRWKLAFTVHVMSESGMVELLLLRVLRSWNQTGDKWLHLTDIGDILVAPYCAPLLIILLLVSFTLIVRSNCVSLGTSRLLLYISSLMIFIFKLNQQFATSESTVLRHVSIWLARLAYFLIAIRFIRLLYLRQSLSMQRVTSLGAIRSSHLLLTVLLAKPVNIPVWCMLVMLSERISKRLRVDLQVKLAEDSSERNPSPHRDNSDLALWFYLLSLANASFFFLGNSNSLSTVDLAAGYVGLSDYNQYVTGFLLLVSTYSGPLFWYLLLFEHCIQSRRDNSIHLVTLLVWYLTMLNSLYALSCYVQRYHLFVWTVFSPKLIYLSVHTWLLCLFLLLLSIA